MLWQPVYIDDKPYYIPLGSFNAYIDYVVTDARGQAVRQGQLNISYKEGPEPPIVIDDCDIFRQPDANPYSPEYDPAGALSTVTFRMLPTEQGTMFQYSSSVNAAVTLRFKVSILFHIPGEYVPVKNIGFIGEVISFNILATGEAFSPPAAQSLYLKNNGWDSFSQQFQDSVNNYRDVLGTMYAVKADSLGNIYECGEGNRGAILIKYNATGQFMWQRSFTQKISNLYDGAFYAMDIDGNGNVICVGRTAKSNTGPIQNSPYAAETGICVKFDPNGVEIFTRTYVDTNLGTNRNVVLLDVVSSPTGIFVTGRMETNLQYDYRSFTARLHQATGVVEWFNHLESNLSYTSVITNNLKIDSEGNILQLGKIDYGNMLMRKYNPDTGSVIWTKSYYYFADYSYHNYSYYTLGPDNSIYHTEVEAQEGNTILITKFDPNGELVWQKRHGYTADSGFDFGICNTLVTNTTIFVITALNFYNSDGIVVMEFDLNGLYIKTRFVAFPSATAGGGSYITASIAHGHIYIAFTNTNSFPDYRSYLNGIIVTPIEWDGSDIKFENMLTIRSVIPNTSEVFDRININTTGTVNTVTNPFTTFSLVESTTPKIEQAPIYDYSRSVIDDGADPLAAIGSPVHLSVNLNTPSGDNNFWVLQMLPLAPDNTYANQLQLYPMAVVSDSFGDVYSYGWYDATGIYGTDKIYLQKTSSTGAIVWFKVLTGTGADVGDPPCHIAVDETGIYTTAVDSFPNDGMIVTKYSLDGNTILWHKEITADGFQCSYCSIDGSNLLIQASTHNNSAPEGYLFKLNRTTGAVNSSMVFNGIRDSVKYLDDGQGNYYMMFLKLGGEFGYSLSKHLKSNDSILWQRKGYINSSLTTSSQINVWSDFCLDPSGNIYVSAVMVDLKQYGGNYPSRRLLVKYASNGTVIAQKTFRVTMALDKPALMSYTPLGCFWAGDRFITLSPGHKDGIGNTLIFDAFDSDLNPLWGRSIFMAGENYYSTGYTPRNMVQSGADASVTCIQFIGDDNFAFLLRIPNDGVFDLKGETGLHLYDLTYAEVTNYPFTEAISTTITAIGGAPVVPFVVTDVIGATIVDYALFSSLLSAI